MPFSFANTTNTQMSIQSFTDIVQSNTGNFDGALPTGALTTLNGQFIFAASTHQGLIDPLVFGILNPLRIDRVVLVMAGQSTYSINLNLVQGGEQVVIASGTTATTYSGEGLGFLMPGQQLQIVTTGVATTSVYAVVSLSNPNMQVVKT